MSVVIGPRFTQEQDDPDAITFLTAAGISEQLQVQLIHLLYL